VNNRLFVTEPSNNRTTVFDTTTITDGENAVNVLGQPNFTTSTSVVSQSSTVQSYAVAYDSNNNRLFVSDNALGTIKIFDTTTIINGENAVNVLGATTFTG
jgi:DNA-binding beta-propeller fold protein YncE